MSAGASRRSERERRDDGATQVDERLARALRDFTNELERRARERGTARHAGYPVDKPRYSGASRPSIVRRDLGLTPRRRQSGRRGCGEPHFAVGDGVFVEALKAARDTVVEDYGDTVLVAMGCDAYSRLQARAARRAALAKVAPQRPARSRAAGRNDAREPQGGASTELDVRGKRFVEAGTGGRPLAR